MTSRHCATHDHPTKARRNAARWWGVGKFSKWLALAIFIAALSVASPFLSPTHWINAFEDWMATLGLFGVAVLALLYALATVLTVPGTVRTIETKP